MKRLYQNPKIKSKKDKVINVKCIGTRKRVPIHFNLEKEPEETIEKAEKKTDTTIDKYFGNPVNFKLTNDNFSEAVAKEETGELKLAMVELSKAIDNYDEKPNVKKNKQQLLSKINKIENAIQKLKIFIK